MKKRGLLKTYIYIIFLMSSVLSSVNGEPNDTGEIQFQSLAKEQVPEVLNFLSTAIKSNYEKITTWKGEADFLSEQIIDGDEAGNIFRKKTDGKGAVPQSILRLKTANIQFIIDVANDSIYEHIFREDPIRYFNNESGNDLGTKSRLHEAVSIVTPQEFIHCVPRQLKGNTITSYRAIKQTSRQKETIARKGIFDPRLLIYMGNPVWNYLDSWRRRFQESNGEVKVGNYSPIFEEGRSGDNIVYHLLLPARTAEDNYTFLNMYFSSEAGYNMTKLQVLGPDYKVYANMNCEYYVLNGIYIPKRIETQDFNLDNGTVRYKEQYILINQQLNQSLDKNTFTYKNLGLKNGDKFIDKIENREYIYQDANLVFVADVNK